MILYVLPKAFQSQVNMTQMLFMSGRSVALLQCLASLVPGAVPTATTANGDVAFTITSEDGSGIATHQL